MTIMFVAFDEDPMILRLYGKATVVYQNDPEWRDLYALFNPVFAARQLFDLSVDLVQTACGATVPLFEYIGEREQPDKPYG